MIALTTNYAGATAVPNGTRLVFGRFDFDDEQQVMTVPVELRSPNATDVLYARVTMILRNGESSLLSRQTNPPAGLAANDPARYFIQTTRNAASGYTDAMGVARGAANTPGGRKNALEAHMLTAGHIDSSLAGVQS